MFAAIPVILASVVAASNFFTNPVANTTVNAGEVLKLRWIETAGDDATLILKNGDASDLKNVTTIVENTPNNGAIDWTVPSDLTTGSYAIEIDANGEINYSTFFTIIGSNITSSSSSSSQVNSTTSSSSPSTSLYINSTSSQVPRTNASSISATSTPLGNASVTSSGSSFHSSKISTRASSTSASSTGNSTSASGHANGAPRSNGYSAIALFFTIAAAFFLL